MSPCQPLHTTYSPHATAKERRHPARPRGQRTAADEGRLGNLVATVHDVVEEHAARVGRRLRSKDHDIGRVGDIALGVGAHVAEIDDPGVVGMLRIELAVRDRRDHRVRARSAGWRRAAVGVGSRDDLEPIDDAGESRTTAVVAAAAADDERRGRQEPDRMLHHYS
jgi:hypothetical protein